MTYEEIINEVAQELNIPSKVVDKAYRGFWKFVRTSIANLPLKEELTEEQFNQLRTSINIPSLGKFYCDYERYSRINKRYKYVKSLKTYDNQKS